MSELFNNQVPIPGWDSILTCVEQMNRLHEMAHKANIVLLFSVNVWNFAVFLPLRSSMIKTYNLSGYHCKTGCQKL